MPIRQDELPRLGNLHYDIADSLNRKAVPRQPFHVTALRRDEAGQIVWDTPTKNHPALHGLAMLAIVNGFDTLHAVEDKKISKLNLVTASRIGGFAAQQIFDLAKAKSLDLSLDAMAGIHSALEGINDKMIESFKALVTTSLSDRDAIYLMNTLHRVLRERR